MPGSGSLIEAGNRCRTYLADLQLNVKAALVDAPHISGVILSDGVLIRDLLELLKKLGRDLVPQARMS